MHKKALLFCDGASSGNPGDSGIGVVLLIDEKRFKFSEYIGKATNNIAEYKALIKGLREAKRHGAATVAIYADSELMVKHISGEYRVKSANLINLYEQAVSLLKEFKVFTIIHIPREKNAEADELAKSAIFKKYLG
ncbi:MAG: ribonuclease H [Thermodesulfovibrio sp.]|nr:ribonuclease H [Thermodesulfovibrio sp.]